MTRTFGTGQKLSLAGMFVGSMMCLVGLGAPYWLVLDPTIEGVHIPGAVAEGNMGVFMVCGEVLKGTKLLGEDLHLGGCEMLPMDDTGSALHIVRLCGCACVLVGGICGLAALCLACCGKGTRFVALGVVCFLAAAVGAAAPIIFAQKGGNLLTTSVLDWKLFSYGWAFYLFCAGVGLLGVVSIMACFSAPENPIGGVVFGHPGPSVIVAQTGPNPYLPLQEPGCNIINTSTGPSVSMPNTGTGY